jgi:hypothetical protein
MLGKLIKVDLREEWKHEAHDFTVWLSQSENIALLSEEIGIEIQVIKIEANVGSFAVDILAEESGTGKKIIIENQLEITDHDHLGKLITYASGLEANYIIWIFKEIREEHKNAIDWLNEISNGQIGFFAIQMELWQIGNSDRAPKFNIVVSPNNWAKAVRDSQFNNTLSENNLFQIDFWNGFSNYLKKYNSILKTKKALPQHWYDCSIGNSQAHLSFIVSVKNNFLRIDFYIDNNKQLYHNLFNKKEEIEKKLGFSMDWQELPDAKASRIALRKDVINIKDETQFEEFYRWYMENGELILKTFQEYLNKFA